MSKVTSIFGGGDDDGYEDYAREEAERQRKEEEARQARIEAAVARINALFGGGMAGVGNLVDPSQVQGGRTYYLADGTPWRAPGNYVDPDLEFSPAITRGPGGVEYDPDIPMQTTSRGRLGTTNSWQLPGGGWTDDYDSALSRWQQAQQASAPPGQLFSSRQQSGGFDQNYYNQIRDATWNYYAPQLQDQFEAARENLVYQLADAGLLRSSVANEQATDLSQQNQLRRGELWRKALGEANNLRSQVEDTRSSLVQQAQTAEDPTATANLAAGRVRALQQQQPDLSPLGQLFKQAAIGYGNFRQGQEAEQLEDYINTPSALSPRKRNTGGRVVEG